MSPPALFPSSIESITLHVTKGTPPNEVTYTENIPYASMGENIFAIKNQQLIDGFSNKPAGTKYSYYVTTNFVPGSFPSSDVLKTPTVSGYTVKTIPACTISEYTFSRISNWTVDPSTIEEWTILISNVLSTNSDSPLNFESSDNSLLTIDSDGKINILGDGITVMTVSQPGNSEYEAISTQATVVVQSTSVTFVPLVLESNGVTIRYTGSPITQSTLPRPHFINADIRRRGTPEWFAVVDDRHRQAIANYARVTDTTTFRSNPLDPNSLVPFNNIVTTNMRNMSSMFANADTFNYPIESWDTSRVTDMSFMFNNARMFNQPIGIWNTGNVVFMFAMFAGAQRFNQNISSWNLDRVFIFFAFRSGSALANNNNYTPQRIINAGQ